MSSMNCTLESMTQMSAPPISLIWLVVSSIRPQKIEPLLGDEQRGESHTQDDAQVFAAVAGQHFQSDPVHDRPFPLRSGLPGCGKWIDTVGSNGEKDQGEDHKQAQSC